MNNRSSEMSMVVILVVVIVTIFVLAILAAQAFAQTPTPGPCDHCPDMDSFSCQLWPDPCYACWQSCGSPQATPTPTATRTPTPTPTPEPYPGPQCDLHVEGPGSIYLVAIYAHEWPERCKRWVYTSDPIPVGPGGWAGHPSSVEGYPIGYEWWTEAGELLKSCGDTVREYPCRGIFEDGFESGTTDAWSQTIGG